MNRVSRISGTLIKDMMSCHGSPRREEAQSGARKVSKEMMAENLPIWQKTSTIAI